MSSRKKLGDEKRYYTPPAMRRYKQQQQENSKWSSSSPERIGLESDSNLDRFLEHTTPSVSAQHFPRTSVQAWRNRNLEFHPYFILGDLWESFTEWSVYGAGVPLVLNGTDSVVQYFVPFLSGIQLYVDPSRNVMERRPGEDSDANSSSSDGENESQPDRGVDISNPPGLLVFEYFERELPYHREPLADKISVLASRFPVLKTHRSCDLTPTSWISIYWYPIYRIPVGPTLQNVETCFLTYHSLAKPIISSEGGFDCGSKFSLPTFGLVPYKLKVSDWNENDHQGQKMSSLFRAADSWLRLLQVNHPDYNFVKSRGTPWR